MFVLSLFRKSQHSDRSLACNVLQCQRGRGIVGDKHASIGSPRQILLVSQPVIEALKLESGLLSENIGIGCEIEAATSGQVLQIGAQVQIRLTFRCEPCHHLETIRPGLAQQLVNRRGMLGQVLTHGSINRGDAIAWLPIQYPPISDNPQERFCDFVRRIPPGKVVRTPQLLMAIGVTASYARVLPHWLKRWKQDLPVHRLVRADGRLFSQALQHQSDALSTEGVQCSNEQVDPAFNWSPDEFYPLTQTLSLDEQIK